ncbi:hypothetical protein I3843_03G243400 [Carya illinoinensis]|nr:hypothetical protein I3843_03G243400 [Carya illinoinensis]
MGFSYREVLLPTLLISAIFLVSPELGATRSLREEGMDKEELLLVESLRPIVPPSGPNPCTYIPGRGSGRCTLNGMNIAGNVLHPPRPAFPGSLIAYSSIPSDNCSQLILMMRQHEGDQRSANLDMHA